jgi:hypothetical protein
LISDNEQRLIKVLQLVHIIAKSEHQKFAAPDNFHNKDFLSGTPIERAEAIYQRIKKPTNLAYRYDLLYFSNAVDQHNSLQPTVSQGRGYKSAAFDAISEGDDTKRKLATRMYNDACQYLKLLEAGGPGLLLLLDTVPKSL